MEIRLLLAVQSKVRELNLNLAKSTKEEKKIL